MASKDVYSSWLDNLTQEQFDAYIDSTEYEYNKLHNHSVPFDETEDYRDFVVWLCGFTQTHKPPNEEEWGVLREKTKKIAVKFALAAKDRARTANYQRSFAKSTFAYDISAIGSTSSLLRE